MIVRSTVLFLCFATVAVAESVSIQGLYGLDDTRYHRIESDELGRGFDILVGLPDDYVSSTSKSYPTIYVLDGGALYPMLRTYYNYLRASEEVPAAIIIGISYGDQTFELGNQRGHDFTAPSDEREYYGGAGDFQNFLADELIPEIESKYRSASDQRVIFGQSLGGQFVLYTAQTRPGLFSGYVASNPALHRNLPFFMKLHFDPGPNTKRPRLFVGSGSKDEERFRTPALSWINYWNVQQNAPWDLKAVTLDSHTHFSAPPASFRRGMAWVFGINSVRPH